MTSFIRNKLLFIPFLSGFILSILVIVIANTLRFLDNPAWVVAAQTTAILALGFAAGFLLNKKLKHSYPVAILALLYTYALSLPVKAITDMIHYGLSAFVTSFIAVGLFYLTNKYFNRLKLHITIKLVIASIGLVVTFLAGATLALYILRLMY